MIRLRPADIHDLALLEYWDTQPHVIAADPDDDWNWKTELKREPVWREMLVAEIEGQPIGFLQIIDPQEEESHYWGAIGPHKRAIDIWIGEASNLGKGYGTEMMRLALERCFVVPEVDEVLIDPLVSNHRAIKFYERIGFQFVEYRSLGDSDCAVYHFLRSTWEK